MTQNSKEAFVNGKEQRETNKKLVLNALKNNPNRSRFSIGAKTGLGDIESQRRLSDLYNEGKIVITGTRKHFKSNVSLYSLKDQLELFTIEKKPSLRQFFNEEAPELLHKYDVLYSHKL